MSVHPPKRILVVDDLAIFREPIKFALRGEGYDVATSANGHEAIVAISHRRPDLILLDIQMPKMGGIALLRYIRRSKSLAELPVLILSSIEDRSRVRRYLDCHCIFRGSLAAQLGKCN